MKLEIFNTRLASQHEAGITARGWHHNKINTKLKIFSTRLASQHEGGITTTSTRS
jgi:hypothetical protein